MVGQARRPGYDHEPEVTQRLGHPDRHWNGSWTLRREVSIPTTTRASCCCWCCWFAVAGFLLQLLRCFFRLLLQLLLLLGFWSLACFSFRLTCWRLRLLTWLSPLLRPDLACVLAPVCLLACLFGCLLIILTHGVPIGNASSKARTCFFDAFFKTRRCLRCPLPKDNMQWLCCDLVVARCLNPSAMTFASSCAGFHRQTIGRRRPWKPSPRSAGHQWAMAGDGSFNTGRDPMYLPSGNQTWQWKIHHS